MDHGAAERPDPGASPSSADLRTLMLSGDVMLGRAVDQILPHPGDPTLRERAVGDARTYVALAAELNGKIPRPVPWSWPWGDALDLLADLDCDARVINLETSITTSGDFAPGKDIHYRMHPGNVGTLQAAGPDVCVLANNHVLDFGHEGLPETLDVLAAAGLRRGGRVGVLAFGRPPAASRGTGLPPRSEPAYTSSPP
jgi:poly-gamma-glutamate synthesis protein (capsule biosynthesis protein)